MTKLSSRAARMTSRSRACSGIGLIQPMTAKPTRARARDGVVVHIMWRMWTNSSVPATAGARLVVSLSGDILSPKYAPEMMAPAVRPRLRSWAVATPTSAMPMVEAVVQEEPVAMETKAQITQAAA